MEDLNLELEELTHLVGGRHRLVTIMQKRLRELQQGARPLVANTDGQPPHRIVAREIREGRIWLLTGEDALRAMGERERQQIESAETAKAAE